MGELFILFALALGAFGALYIGYEFLALVFPEDDNLPPPSHWGKS